MPSLLLLLLSACATTGGSALGELLAPHDEHPVEVHVLVVDLDTGETVFAREAERLCRPASTMKLLTTSSTCRRELDRRFVTQVICDGAPEGSVTLIGGGDPFLTTADVRRMAATIAAQGVRRIRGPIRVMDPLRDAPRWGEGWMWDDEPSVFQPLLAGMTVDRGCVTVEVAAAEGGLEAKLLPVAGELLLRVDPGGERLRVSRGRYRDEHVVRVSGAVEGPEPEQRRISVPDPARFAGHVLVDALRRAGVACGGDVEVVAHREVPSGIVASCRRSLADVVVETDKVSDNLGAELLLRHLAAVDEANPTALGAGAETVGRMVVEGDLEQLGVASGGCRVADGSGVSHYNLVSADLLVRLLVDMHEFGGEGYELFRRSLPIAGVDGTLRYRMKGTAAEGRVFAKTGTISAVSNLAGYIETRSGRHLAFAVLCQNFVGPAGPWRDLQDRICALLADG
ncbi:MAG: D-alanyl-D-alanine carboxypeptidase/D-alanyl-D-alanine-endopeptidase [Planctomycetes bacterium]|nr:D-alanyl-D-alanine carboxypeptidase/D-alanyl-D-alanine-endopeptidase [Planctomycetota bacterium]